MIYVRDAFKLVHINVDDCSQDVRKHAGERDQYLRLEAETCLGRKRAACESQVEMPSNSRAP